MRGAAQYGVRKSENPDVRPAYAGDIDWNAIYRRYYDLDGMHAALEAWLKAPATMVFSGFAELAARLSARHQVHFVEFHESVAASARDHHPVIAKVSRADVIDAVRLDPAPVVLVAGRVSAYWQGGGDLARFLQNVLQRPRELVLVDFFDAADLDGAGGPALGCPTYSDVRPVAAESALQAGGSAAPGDHPALLLARTSGRYSLEGTSIEYCETRAFFSREFVLHAAEAALPDPAVNARYDLSIEAPLVHGEAGFTLLVRASE